MIFGSVKGYSIEQISLKMLDNKKWDFSQLEKEESNIKIVMKELLENNGVIFALSKKKVINAVYLFKLVVEDNDKTLLFDTKLLSSEITDEMIEEFENDITTLLGEVVVDEEFTKAIWKDQEIEISKVKIGKMEIPVAVVWILAGIIFSILFDDFLLFTIYLCIGISSGYIVKVSGTKTKKDKSTKKKNNK